MAPELSQTTSLSYVIAQAARAADRDPHSPDLVFYLGVEQGLDVGFAGEHLDRGAGAADLLRVAGLADEEQYAEDVAAPIHAQDACHPGPDPFEVLC